MQVQIDDYRRGAAIATDLVNTSAEVMVSSGDAIPTPAALSGFLARRQVHPDALAGGRLPTRDEVADVTALRRTLRGLIEAPDAAEATTRAGALTLGAGAGPTLRPDHDGRWQWWVHTRPGAPLVDELAVLTATGLLAVIRHLAHDRFRSCASPSCAGVFVDTSRAGRRRYCEPDICGNRINVANHRARRAAAKPTPPEPR